MSNLINFYGDKAVTAKIEYVVNSYEDLSKNTVPYEAAILISSPNFQDIQTISVETKREVITNEDGSEETQITTQYYTLDCHNTVWIKTKDINYENGYKLYLYANTNVNGATLKGCSAATYNLDYSTLIAQGRQNVTTLEQNTATTEQEETE